MTTDGQRPAERISIALMAEARRFMNEPHRAQDWVIGEALADRLAQWATDVRQLGLDYATELRTQRSMISEAQEQRDEARAKLARVRELVTRIQPGDHAVLVSAQVRDILEAIDG